jgi:hypothetical protein
MNIIEERIRAAARAAGDTVSPESVPPLELPAEHPRAAGGGRRSWLIPVAAAAAVIVVVAVTAVTVRHATRTPAPAPTIAPAATAPGPMLPGPSLASYVSAGVIPPYFVSVAFTGEPTESPAVAVVHDTVSGQVLATIKPSIRGGTIRAVSAAGDNRTFLLDEQTWAKSLPHVAVTEYAGPHTFFLLRLGSAGQVSSLTRLRATVPATQVLDAFALSPDAKRLALVVQARKHSQGRTNLEVVTLSTGSTRVWTAASGFFRSGAGDPRGLSWTADGRELAFEWQVNNVGEYPPVEARLLDLTSPGGDLLAASRRVIATTRQFTPSGSTFQVSDGGNEPVVTPDGSAIVTNTVYFQVKTKESGQATNGRYGFAEYSTRTGKLLRILGYWKVKPAGYWFTQTLWSSPSGRVLIGFIPDGRIGVINGNEFTPLNMPPVPSVVIDVGLGAGAGAW